MLIHRVLTYLSNPLPHILHIIVPRLLTDDVLEVHNAENLVRVNLTKYGVFEGGHRPWDSLRPASRMARAPFK